MHLEGQYERRDAGYAMAVLLASIAILSVVWLMVVPVWKQAVQREKEAELIFRAGQYARAVALYQRRFANAFPPSVEVLMKEKMLRKKYVDPMTNRDFRLLSPLELQASPGMTTLTPVGGAPGGFGSRPGAGGSRSSFGTQSGGSSSGDGSVGGGFGRPSDGGGGTLPQPGDPTSRSGFSPSRFGANAPGSGPAGGIAAAVSRSTAQSIRVFKNRRQYNQWIVTVEDVMPRRAAGAPGQPGQPNQPGMPGSQNPGMPGPSTSPFPGGTSPSPFPSNQGGIR